MFPLTLPSAQADCPIGLASAPETLGCLGAAQQISEKYQQLELSR
jgi:hypothetical protein